MNEQDEIPVLLAMCQTQTHTRPAAQLALEQYRVKVLQLAYGPGTSEERKEACEKARRAFEFHLREILVPFLTAPPTNDANDYQMENGQRSPTNDENS